MGLGNPVTEEDIDVVDELSPFWIRRSEIAENRGVDPVGSIFVSLVCCRETVQFLDPDRIVILNG